MQLNEWGSVMDLMSKSVTEGVFCFSKQVHVIDWYNATPDVYMHDCLRV